LREGVQGGGEGKRPCQEFPSFHARIYHIIGEYALVDLFFDFCGDPGSGFSGV
jgi:hypothetical protein